MTRSIAVLKSDRKFFHVRTLFASRGQCRSSPKRYDLFRRGLVYAFTDTHDCQTGALPDETPSSVHGHLFGARGDVGLEPGQDGLEVREGDLKKHRERE